MIKREIWLGEAGQDVAEYPVLLAVLLVLTMGAVRLIGVTTTDVFSRAAVTEHQDAD